jgi:pimeloyl-ACP methyl ester carboxylesterase
MFVSKEAMTVDEAAKKFAKGKFMTVDGKKVHYLEKGNGKPIILLHGYTYHSMGWKKNIDALAKKFTVYAIDTWGHGYSERLKESDYTIEQYGKQVIGFMDVLQIRTSSLVGHSMGGAIAVYTTAHYPDRVDRTILVGAAVLPHEPATIFKFLGLPFIGEFISSVPGDALFKAVVKKSCFQDPNWPTDAYFEELRQPGVIKGTQAGMLYIRRNFFKPPFLRKEAEMLAKMDKPILLAHGVGDGLVPVNDSKKLHKMWKTSTLEIFDKAKHNLHEEYPDKFNTLVEDFLTK